MTAGITTAARRIASAANAANPGQGGFLAFRADGTGGEWYSDGSLPDVEIRYPVPTRRVTAADVQAWLDARDDER